MPSHQLGAVTGASSGIGYELARCCVEHGFDLLIAADEPAIPQAAEDMRRMRIRPARRATMSRPTR